MLCTTPAKMKPCKIFETDFTDRAKEKRNASAVLTMAKGEVIFGYDTLHIY